MGELNNPNPQPDSFATDIDLKKNEEKSAWDHLTDLSDMIKK